MPTIIDSLLVKLGLDSKDYDAGKKKVDKGLKETGDNADKAGVKVAKFLAIVGGVAAIERFVQSVISSNAELARFARNVEDSTENISAWSNAAELAGGSAAGLQGTLDMLSRAQTDLALTGQSSLVPYFAALGVSIADVSGKARGGTDILLDLADRFAGLDRRTAFNMGRMMGIDPGTMNLLLKGRQEVELMIKRQREFGAVSKEDAERAEKYQAAMIGTRQSLEALGRELVLSASPALETFGEWLGKAVEWMRDNREVVKDFLTVMAVGLGLVAAATMPINGTVLAITALGGAIALLWQDYQTWKRGGESFIDWAKWEPGIQMATRGLTLLKDLMVDMLVRAVALGDAIIKLAKGDFAGAKVAGKAALFGIPGVGLQAPAAPPPAAAPAPTPGASPEAAAMAYFQSQGWSKEQAAGLAANVKRESQFNPAAVGDKGKAYGIGQWHPDRQAEFARVFGKPMQGSSLQEQLAFMQYELTKGNEQRAGNVLRGTGSAADAAAAVSRYYERPADVAGEAATRAQMASALMGLPGATSAAMGAGASAVAKASAAGAGRGMINPGATVDTHIGEIKVYTAATDADGIAKDMGKSMDYLFTSQFATGLN